MDEASGRPGEAAKTAYTVRRFAVAGLTPELRAAMGQLYLDNYAGTSLQRFAQDLAEKDEALLLFHAGELAGFTLLMSYAAEHAGQPLRVVYSGDTVVARRHWGQQALAFAWLRRVGEIRRQAPTVPLYWFLLVKGHRTYKYLSVFARQFHPHWQRAQPELQALAGRLAGERYPADYDTMRGIVHFPESHGHLRPEIAEATPEEMTRPAVRYFFERNPGFRQGDELVCLCELAAHNMKPLAARIFQRAFDGAGDEC